MSLGVSGLVTARTYLQVNPSAKVLILESASSIGGVWAEHRLYPSLKSNNMLGTYEFSDFPMDPETYDIKPGQHIPGHIVHKYLTNYAERFDLISRMRFETNVESAEHKSGGGWILRTAKGEEIATKKLAMATGLTSDPFIPTFVGSETFGAPLFHMKYFLDHEDTLKSAKNVVVMGGAKSAWDAVYAYASRGVHVDWVIRGKCLSQSERLRADYCRIWSWARLDGCEYILPQVNITTNIVSLHMLPLSKNGSRSLWPRDSSPGSVLAFGVMQMAISGYENSFIIQV